jgi:hypothetical protein
MVMPNYHWMVGRIIFNLIWYKPNL